MRFVRRGHPKFKKTKKNFPGGTCLEKEVKKKKWGHFSRSVINIFMIRTWDERNIAIFSAVYMIRVHGIDLNASKRLEKLFEHEMTKTKMRLRRKKI